MTTGKPIPGTDEYNAIIAAKEEAISEICRKALDDEAVRAAHRADVESGTNPGKFEAEIRRIVSETLKSEKYKSYGFDEVRIFEIAAENVDINISNGDMS